VILVSKTYWAGAPFRFQRPPDADVCARTLRSEDGRDVRVLYFTPRSATPPAVAVVAMHPRVDFTQHYMFPSLIAAGYGCLGATTRHPNDDTDLVHEEAIFDLAATVWWLREQRGVRHVLLLGNSGGGSLAAFFQAQARRSPEARLATTPAGEPTRLRTATLVPADALVLVAAHCGQGRILGQCIDGSVTDETDPFSTDESLDMYSPSNGFRTPPEWTEYDEAFVKRYRDAQRARVARIDEIARAHVSAARDAAEHAGAPSFEALPLREQQLVQRRQAFEPIMVVYRTMASLAYVDKRIEPSERAYGSLLSPRPDLMSFKALGFARTVTPRAWLSTWSAASTNADLPRNLREVTEPTVVVHAARDREIYPSDAREIFEASAATDKTFVEIEGAEHYFEPELGAKNAPHRDKLMEVVVGWIRERFG